jgi:hypothetical protein
LSAPRLDHEFDFLRDSATAHRLQVACAAGRIAPTRSRQIPGRCLCRTGRRRPPRQPHGQSPLAARLPGLSTRSVHARCRCRLLLHRTALASLGKGVRRSIS